MPAYVIVDVQVTDRARYDEYKKLVGPTLEQYGGRFVVRGGLVHALEGDWAPERVVVIEFESVENAKRWWESPEYAGAKKLRQASATTDMIVVEGD